MKRKFILLPILGMLLAGCGGSGVAPTGVTVTAAGSKTSIAVDETLQMTAVVAPAEASQSVTWSVTDTAVASVSATGLVKGLADGEVRVKATSTVDTSKVGTYTLTVGAAYESIASVLTAPAGEHTVQGVAVAICWSGFMISDNTGYISTYIGKDYDGSVAVGDFVKLKGTTSVYNGVTQFGADVVISDGSGTKPTIADTPEVWDGAAMDAWNGTTTKLVKITAAVTVSGNYKNGAVAGASKTLSLQCVNDLEWTDGAKWELTGYTLYLSGSTGSYVNMMLVSRTAAGPDPEPETKTVAEILAAGIGSYKTKVVVVATYERGFLGADTTGKILVYLNAVPTVAINAYVSVEGAVTEYNGNLQFGSTAVITALTETAPVISDTPVAWGATEWDAYDYSVGTLVSMKIKYVGGSYPFFTLDGATKEGRVGYPNDSLGFVAANAGRYFNVVAYTIGSAINSEVTRGLIMVKTASIVSADAPESLTVNSASDTVSAGATLQMSAAVLPSTASQAVVWSVENGTGTATISVAGLLSGLTAGTVTVKAVHAEVATVYNTKVITVTAAEEKSLPLSITFAGAFTDGWTYITNNPSYPDPSWYKVGGENAGLKMNQEGMGILSPIFTAVTQVTTVLNITALNENTKTSTADHNFKVEALNAANEVVDTDYVDVNAAGVQTGAVSEGTGIVRVRIIMIGYPNNGTKYCNVNFGGVALS